MITLRVFLSSTFKDMAADRDELVRRRFPKLRAWAEGLGVHLVEVDLRWGVTSPSSLGACLKEVDECRPLFVCFLGHHFGSRVSEKALIPELLAEHDWISKDRHLVRSYTEMEIIHAILREHTPPMDALFYFRAAALSAEVEKKLGMENEDAHLQEALKERIRRSGAPVREEYGSFAQLGAWVEEDLRRSIAQRAAEHRPGTGWMQRRGRRWAGGVAALEALSSAVHRHWQPGWLGRLKGRAPRGGVVVAGAPGCGKSTLLASWARLLGGERVQLIGADTPGTRLPELEKVRALRPTVLCLSAEDDPPGAPSGGSIAWPRLAWRVLDFIRRRWAPEMQVPPDTSPMALLYALPGAFEKVPAGALLLLVADGLDLLPDRSRADALAWLPAELPASVCVVTSLSEGASALASKRGWVLQELPPRPSQALLGPWLAASLRDHGKYLTTEQSGPAERLIASVPARWMGLVLADLHGISSRRLLMPRIEALARAAHDPPALGRLLLEGLARRQGARLVWRALALLMEARTGLFEMEWRALLRPSDLPTMPAQIWSPVFYALRDWLQPSSGVQAPTPELRVAWEAWLAARPGPVAARRRAIARQRLEEFFIGEGASSPRALEQLPWLCRCSPPLLQKLLSPPWLGALWRDRPDEARVLWRVLDDAGFARVLALWDSQFINLDGDGWHALSDEAARRRLDREALDAARRARELACPAAGLAEAHVLQGIGRQDEAVGCLRELSRRADVPEPAATQAQLLLADCLIAAGEVTQAADCARAALARASQRGEPGLWMQACRFLGDLTLHGTSPASALPFYQELERLAGLTGARHEWIVARQGIGDALGWVDGRRGESIHALRDAVLAAERLGDASLHQSVLGSLIRVLREEPGGIMETPALIIERLALAQETSDHAAEAQALFQYAQLHQDRDEPGEAFGCYQQAHALAERTGQPALARECRAAMDALRS